jgi:hypothetical protein
MVEQWIVTEAGPVSGGDAGAIVVEQPPLATPPRASLAVPLVRDVRRVHTSPESWPPGSTCQIVIIPGQ